MNIGGPNDICGTDHRMETTESLAANCSCKSIEKAKDLVAAVACIMNFRQMRVRKREKKKKKNLEHSFTPTKWGKD
jgi:hypothetical protein